MTKKAKDLHTFRGRREIKKDIRLNRWELNLLERAIHCQGLRNGDFPPLAAFIRTAALAKAYSMIQQWHKRPKVEHESECAEN